jgi:hypothetical protein
MLDLALSIESMAVAGAVSRGPPASLTFTNKNGITVTPQSDGSVLLQKSSADGWDGAAYTASSLDGNFMMVVRTFANDKNFFAGGSANPSGSSINGDFTRAINGNGAGSLSGVVGDAPQTSTSYAANEYEFLKRVGGVFTVGQGLTEDPSLATWVGDLGITNSSATYGIKVSLYYQNSQVKVRAYAL